MKATDLNDYWSWLVWPISILDKNFKKIGKLVVKIFLEGECMCSRVVCLDKKWTIYYSHGFRLFRTFQHCWVKPLTKHLEQMDNQSCIISQHKNKFRACHLEKANDLSYKWSLVFVFNQAWCNTGCYKSLLRQNVATLASRRPNWRDAGRWACWLHHSLREVA